MFESTDLAESARPLIVRRLLSLKFLYYYGTDFDETSIILVTVFQTIYLNVEEFST